MCELMTGLCSEKKSPLMAQAYIISRGLEEFMAAREQLNGTHRSTHSARRSRAYSERNTQHFLSYIAERRPRPKGIF